MNVLHYFAYGSNMNPARVAERGLRTLEVGPALLANFELCFDKTSAAHAGSGHANIRFAREAQVEGVAYRLADAREIEKMDPFERAPINYGRDVVRISTPEGEIWAWTYFANAAVRSDGLFPTADYLSHLLAGRDFLSEGYWQHLQAWRTADG